MVNTTMTTCIRNTKEVTKTVTETVNCGYTLHLTDAQAQSVRSLLSCIGGTHQIRLDADAVAEALERAGVAWKALDTASGHHSIYPIGYQA